jgi:hypothetical protein
VSTRGPSSWNCEASSPPSSTRSTVSGPCPELRTVTSRRTENEGAVEPKSTDAGFTSMAGRARMTLVPPQVQAEASRTAVAKT